MYFSTLRTEMMKLQQQHCWLLPWKLTTAGCSMVSHRNFRQQNSYSTKYQSNFYQVLGLENNSTQAQIKSAYYKLSKEYHPDRNDGSKFSQEMFSKINEAYSILGNNKLRKRYDQGILTQRDRTGLRPHHPQPPTAAPMGRELGDQFTATFRSAHTEHVVDKFLKKRYRENIDKYQEDRKYKQIREEEYRALQERAQRTPVVLIGLMLLGFGLGSLKLLGMGPFNEVKTKVKKP